LIEKTRISLKNQKIKNNQTKKPSIEISF